MSPHQPCVRTGQDDELRDTMEMQGRCSDATGVHAYKAGPPYNVGEWVKTSENAPAAQITYVPSGTSTNRYEVGNGKWYDEDQLIRVDFRRFKTFSECDKAGFDWIFPDFSRTSSTQVDPEEYFGWLDRDNVCKARTVCNGFRLFNGSIRTDDFQPTIRYKVGPKNRQITRERQFPKDCETLQKQIQHNLANRFAKHGGNVASMYRNIPTTMPASCMLSELETQRPGIYRDRKCAWFKNPHTAEVTSSLKSLAVAVNNTKNAVVERDRAAEWEQKVESYLQSSSNGTTHNPYLASYCRKPRTAESGQICPKIKQGCSDPSKTTKEDCLACINDLNFYRRCVDDAETDYLIAVGKEWTVPYCRRPLTVESGKICPKIKQGCSDPSYTTKQGCIAALVSAPEHTKCMESSLRAVEAYCAAKNDTAEAAQNLNEAKSVEQSVRDAAKTITVADTSDIIEGMLVSDGDPKVDKHGRVVEMRHVHIPHGTTVESINDNTITLSNPVEGVVGKLTFQPPPPEKQEITCQAFFENEEATRVTALAVAVEATRKAVAAHNKAAELEDQYKLYLEADTNDPRYFDNYSNQCITRFGADFKYKVGEWVSTIEEGAPPYCRKPLTDESGKICGKIYTQHMCHTPAAQITYVPSEASAQTHEDLYEVGGNWYNKSGWSTKRWVGNWYNKEKLIRVDDTRHGRAVEAYYTAKNDTAEAAQNLNEAKSAEQAVRGAAVACDVREMRPGWCPSDKKQDCLDTCCWANDNEYQDLVASDPTLKLTYDWPQLTNCHSWEASVSIASNYQYKCIKAPNTAQNACIAGDTPHEHLAFPLCKNLCCLPSREHCGSFGTNPPLCRKTMVGRDQIDYTRRGQWIDDAKNDLGGTRMEGQVKGGPANTRGGIGADGRGFLQTVPTWKACMDRSKTAAECEGGGGFVWDEIHECNVSEYKQCMETEKPNDAAAIAASEKCVSNATAGVVCVDPSKTKADCESPNSWESFPESAGCVAAKQAFNTDNYTLTNDLPDKWLPYKGGCLRQTGRWVTDLNVHDRQENKTGAEGEYTYIKNGPHRRDGGGAAFTHELIPLGERPEDYCCTPLLPDQSPQPDPPVYPPPVRSCALFKCGQGTCSDNTSKTKEACEKETEDEGYLSDYLKALEKAREEGWCPPTHNNTWTPSRAGFVRKTSDSLQITYGWDLEHFRHPDVSRTGNPRYIEGMWNNGNATCESTVDGEQNVCTPEDCCEYKMCHDLAREYKCSNNGVLRSLGGEESNSDHRVHFPVSTLYQRTAYTSNQNMCDVGGPQQDFDEQCCIAKAAVRLNSEPGKVSSSCATVFNSGQTACLNIKNENWHGYPKRTPRLSQVPFGPFKYFSRTHGANTLSNALAAFWRGEPILQEPSIHSGWLPTKGSNQTTNHNWVPMEGYETKTCEDEFGQPRPCTIRDCCRPVQPVKCSHGVSALRDAEKAEEEWWRFPCSRDMQGGEEANCFTHAGLAERMIGLKKGKAVPKAVNNYKEGHPLYGLEDLTSGSWQFLREEGTEQCRMCAPGYHLDSNDKCKINNSTCSNGTPHSNTDAGYCKDNTGNECNNTPYEKCDADGSGETWVRFGRDGTDCKSCNPGFRLQKIGDNPIRTLFGEGDDFRSERVHQPMRCVSNVPSPFCLRNKYIMHLGNKRHCELEGGTWATGYCSNNTGNRNGKPYEECDADGSGETWVRCNVASDPKEKGTCAMALAMGQESDYLHKSRFCHMNSAADLTKLYGGNDSYVWNTKRAERKQTCCENAPLQTSLRNTCEHLRDGSYRLPPLPKYNTCAKIPNTCAKIPDDLVCRPRTQCTQDQYESSAPTDTTDRECADLTVCRNGEEYESKAPAEKTDRECTPLRTCPADTMYESKAPTPTTDRQCEYLTECGTQKDGTTTRLQGTAPGTCAACDSGSWAAVGRDNCTEAFTDCGMQKDGTTTRLQGASTTAPGTCAACESGSWAAVGSDECADLTVCGGSQYESKAPTATADRECANLTVCSAGKYESKAPTDTTDRECENHTVCGNRVDGACSDGASTDKSTCESTNHTWTAASRQISVGTQFADTVCAACTANASAATGSDNCECDDGYRQVGSACVAWGGACENGELKPQAQRTDNNQCGACNAGYHLNGNSCHLNECVCGNGTADPDCPTHDQQKCSACNKGYYRKYDLGTCSDGASTNQSACESTDHTWTAGNIHSEISKGTCSDGISTKKTMCESTNHTWTVTNVNVNDLSTKCVEQLSNRSSTRTNNGHWLGEIREPKGCISSYDEATVEYMLENTNLNYTENDLRAMICLQPPEGKELVCDDTYYLNSSRDACVSCSPQNHCQQNGNTCPGEDRTRKVACVTPDQGYYIDNTFVKKFRLGTVLPCTVQDNCTTHGSGCVGTQKTCIQADDGYQINSSGLVEEQPCTVQANCYTHVGDGSCSVMSSGNLKRECRYAKRGFYVSSGGEVQACEPQNNCISHFPVGDRECVGSTGQRHPCAQPEDGYYLENDLVVQCEDQTNCQTYVTPDKCVHNKEQDGTQLRKCATAKPGYLLNVDGRVTALPNCSANAVYDSTCVHERFVNDRGQCQKQGWDRRGFPTWRKDNTVSTEATCTGQKRRWSYGQNQKSGNNFCESITDQTTCNKNNIANNLRKSCVWVPGCRDLESGETNVGCGTGESSCWSTAATGLPRAVQLQKKAAVGASVCEVGYTKVGNGCQPCPEDPNCNISATACTSDGSKRKCSEPNAGYYAHPETGVVAQIACPADKPLFDVDQCRAVNDDDDCYRVNSEKPVFDSAVGECRERTKEDCTGTEYAFVEGKCLSPEKDSHCEAADASKPVYDVSVSGLCRERGSGDCPAGHWLTPQRACEKWTECDEDTEIEEQTPLKTRNRVCRLPKNDVECRNKNPNAPLYDSATSLKCRPMRFSDCAETGEWLDSGTCKAHTQCLEGQTEWREPSSSQDRVCCPAGELLTDAGECSPPLSDEECGKIDPNTPVMDVQGCRSRVPKDCSADTYFAAGMCLDLTPCGADEYETNPDRGPTEDRECVGVTECPETQVETRAPGPLQDRLCGCPDAHWLDSATEQCTPWALACSSDHFEAQTPSPTQDRECRLPTEDAECKAVRGSRPVYDANEATKCRAYVAGDCKSGELFKNDTCRLPQTDAECVSATGSDTPKFDAGVDTKCRPLREGECPLWQPIADGDGKCRKREPRDCSEGQWLDNDLQCAAKTTECAQPGYYVEASNSKIADNVCKAWPGDCANGNPKPLSERTSANQCDSCTGAYWLDGDECKPWTVCTVGEQVQKQAPNNTQDRQCRGVVASDCSSKQWFTGSACKLWTACAQDTQVQVQAPSRTRDRLCRVVEASDCLAGQWLDGNRCKDKTTTCPDGHYVVQSNTNTADNACVAWRGECENGEPKPQGQRTADDQCGSCDDGHWLNRDACDPWTVCAEGTHVQERAPDGMQDRLCRAVGAADCSADQWITGGRCENKTTVCDPGYYLVASDRRTADNACTPWGGACANGVLKQQSRRTQENHCGSCDAGHWLDGGECKLWTTCSQGTQVETQAPSGTRDRQCRDATASDCPSGQWFNGWKCDDKTTECPAGHYLAASNSSTSDNACTPWGGECANGVLKLQLRRTKADDCGSCNVGHWLDDGACTPWTTCAQGTQVETQAPSDTQDRICRTTGASDCSEGQWFDGTRCKDKTTSCSVGHYLVLSDSDAADNACTAWAGECANGELKPQAQRTADDQCGACDDGYWFKQGACEPWTVCAEGTEVEAEAPSARWDRQCRAIGASDCSDEQWLDGGRCKDKTSACAGGRYLVASNSSTADNACTPWGGECANGELKPQAQRARENHCGSCNSGFWLNGNTCAPWTVCAPGVELETQTPNSVRDRQCRSVGASDCADGQWFNGTVCEAWTACAEGTHVQTRAPDSTQDRACRALVASDCSDGQWLDGGRCKDKTTSCAAGHNRVDSDSKSEDNTCVAWAGECANGELKPQAQRTRENDCGECDFGFWLDGEVCTPWTVCEYDTQVETRVPSSTQDRQCRATGASDCRDHQWLGDAGKCETKTTSCAAGYHLVESSSKSVDNACVAWGGECDNGTMKSQALRARENDCGSCDAGYWLNGAACNLWTVCAQDTQVETQAPDGNRDRVCRATRYDDCAEGQLLAEGKCKDSTTTCDAGYYLKQPEPWLRDTTDNTCEPWGGACANGELKAQALRTRENDCGACSAGYYLGDNNMCTAWAGACADGVLKPVPERTADDQCGSCNSGFWFDQGTCKAWTACAEGTQIQTQAPSGVRDRLCRNVGASDCPDGHWFGGGRCNPKRTACDNGYYFTASNSSTADNTCTAWSGACANGNLKPQSLRIQDNDCESCDSGYWLNGNACQAWVECAEGTQVESLSPNDTRDRQCRPTDPSDCLTDEWFDGGECKGKTTECAVGYYLNVASADSKSSNNTCVAWGGVCANGVLKPLSERTGDNQCGSCTGNYWFDDGICKPWSTCTQGTQMESRAPNNTQDRQCRAIGASDCSTGQWLSRTYVGNNTWDQQCQNKTTSCDPGYYLSVTNSKTADNTCVAWGGVCDNGELKKLQAVRTADDQCGSCVGQFWLDGDVCRPWSSECPGVQTKAPSNTADRQCRSIAASDCSADEWFKGGKCRTKITQCDSGHYLAPSNSNTADNACVAWGGVCANGMLKAQGQRTKENDCGLCTGEYWLNGGVCSPWKTCAEGTVQKTVPNNTRDRQCRMITSGDCGPNQWLNNTTCEDKTTGCAPGHYLRAPPSWLRASTDNTCTPWAGYCANGTLKEQSERTKRNDCASCNSGYWLDGGRCKKWSNACGDRETETQAPNSTQDRLCRPAIASDCSDDQWFQFGKCKGKTLLCGSGLRLQTSNSNTSDNTCVPWGGQCENGTLKQQSQRMRENDCGSCTGEFWLDGSACSPWTPCAKGMVEQTAPSNVQDRKCRAMVESDCGAGQTLEGGVCKQITTACVATGQSCGGCADTNNGAKNTYQSDCSFYASAPAAWCGEGDDGDFKSKDMCCVCGGGDKKTCCEGTECLGGVCADPTACVAVNQTCCTDTNNGVKNAFNLDCNFYKTSPTMCGSMDTADFKSKEMCCACGGGGEKRTCCEGTECSAGVCLVPPVLSSTPSSSGASFEPPSDVSSSGCTNTNNGAKDAWGDDCSYYDLFPKDCGSNDDDDFNSPEMCCACGGGSSGNASSSSDDISALIAASPGGGSSSDPSSSSSDDISALIAASP
ncbi:MAG: hypothetical protein CL450_06000, partial [Acidimicrobiaceae bacterium]|nr:hypothetical protein [Acidimicrobiaceae bacterium]